MLKQEFEKNKNNNLKLLFSMFRGHYKNLAGSVFFYILKHSPVWIFPIVTANIMNMITKRPDNALFLILMQCGFMALCFTQNIFTSYIHVWFYAKTVRAIEKELRFELVKKLQSLTMYFHRGIEAGRLQSKIIRDVEQVQTLASQIFITIFGIILDIVVAFSVIGYKNKMVLLVFLCTIPIAVFCVLIFKDKMKEYNREFREMMEDTSVKVMEMVDLIPITRAHALEKEEIKKMQKQFQKLEIRGLKLDMIQTWFGAISWVIFQIFQVLCLGFTSYLAWNGKIGVGDIVLYQNYFGTLIGQVSAIITLLPMIAKGLESIHSIGEILTEKEVEENQGKEKLEAVKGDIIFENVQFSYEDKEIFKNLNLHIKQGETVAFVGDSGGGKTTILNLLIGFLQIQGGKILIDGHDLKQIDMRSFREHIAIVTQETILFRGTLKDNITYGKHDVTNEELEQAVKGANLEEIVQKLERGLETKISEHGNNLSGGQKQRVSLARAFIRNPDILILDEATSALDSVSEKKIQNSIENLVKNRTTLVVAHRLSTIKNADKIVVIGNGGIIECGNYEELMEKKGKFYEMRTLQI